MPKKPASRSKATLSHGYSSVRSISAARAAMGPRASARAFACNARCPAVRFHRITLSRGDQGRVCGAGWRGCKACGEPVVCSEGDDAARARPARDAPGPRFRYTGTRPAPARGRHPTTGSRGPHGHGLPHRPLVPPEESPMPDHPLLHDRSGAPIEQPAAVPSGNALFGSDVVADTLRALNVPFIALNPGSSYRGLHDSLVNHLGNRAPQMLLCLHEEHAVAIAHGYAKASGRPMAVALHSNVGLMHGSMAIFNAWCDRQPMLILGATGPVDASLRRPWIDWIHTAQDQGGLIRNFVKWDDQPGSVAAIPESMLRAWQQTATAPHGPVYVCLDAAVQEQRIETPVVFPDPARYRPAPPARADAAALAQAAELLAKAKRPVILYGRGRRTLEDWNRRVALAERLGARMLSDLK